MTATQANEAGLIPNNHYVVCDPLGRVVRICDSIFSFSATTYRAQNGRLTQVC